jgi:hypothetical protein
MVSLSRHELSPASVVTLAIVAALAVALPATAVRAAPLASDPHLRLWFHADMISGVSDGANFATWADSSSYANNLASFGAQPIYEAGETGTIGGRAYVRFSGSPMRTASNVGISGNLTTTVFIVTKQNTAAATGLFGWGDTAVVSGAFGMWTSLRGSGKLSAEYAGSQPAAFGDFSTSNFQIMELQKTPGAINTTTSLTVDGVSQAVQPGASGATPNVSAGLFYLGQWANFSGNFMDGNVAEVIVYDTALDAEQSADISNYLQQKFTNVPEPSSIMVAAIGMLMTAAPSHRARAKRR